jgi:hypothetical protein
VSISKQAHEAILYGVRVLIFVDVYILPLCTEIFQYVGVRFKEADGFDEQVVEVECSFLDEQFFIALICAADHYAEESVLGKVFNIPASFHIALVAGDEGMDFTWRKFLRIDPAILHCSSKKAEGIVFVENGKSLGNTDGLTFLSQYVYAEAVECADPR